MILQELQQAEFQVDQALRSMQHYEMEFSLRLKTAIIQVKLEELIAIIKTKEQEVSDE